MKIGDLNKTFVFQREQTDCGVACLLSIINHFEGSSNLDKLRKASGTSKQGTTLLGLYQAANAFGFNAEGYLAEVDELKDNSSPIILHVLIDNILEHYVVCYGYEKNRFIIGDPANGISYYSEDELKIIWKSRNCLILEPNENFVKASETNDSKSKWFLKLLKEDYTLLGICVGLGIGVALLSMAMAIFSQKLIDDILPSKDLNKLITGIVLLSLLLLVRIGLGSLREFFLIKQGKDFNNRIISNFFSSILHLPKSFFDTRKIGELIARLNDTNRIQGVINLMAGNFVIDILISVISLVFLFYYSWVAGVIATISLPVYFLLIYSFNKSILIAQKETMQSYALSESNYIASIQGIREIKNHNKQYEFEKINELIYGKFQEKIFGLGKINIKIGLWGGMASVFFLISILSYTSFKVLQGSMQLGELMAILSIAGSLLPSVTNLALITIPINEAKIAFDRMFEYVDIDSENFGDVIINEFKSLNLKNVVFRFVGRSLLLNDINLEIKKHELIAIVGESGSGKSTLGQILQKFYDYGSGSITVNNSFELKDVDLSSWRNIIGVVPQDVSIFPGNVIDNICLGNKANIQNVKIFCKKNGFDKFIDELPHRYYTILGEDGINLSGGQKQIIALARALYKNPQFLILDEATSAMDGETEQFTLDLLGKLRKKMGIIFISHRLHILRNCADMIYILEKGNIKFKGNHETLMGATNFYSSYWKSITSSN